MESIIKSSDIYMQDIICDEVQKNINMDDYTIYNAVTHKLDIKSLNDAMRVLFLIKKNKSLLK